MCYIDYEGYIECVNDDYGRNEYHGKRESLWAVVEPKYEPKTHCIRSMHAKQTLLFDGG